MYFFHCLNSFDLHHLMTLNQFSFFQKAKEKKEEELEKFLKPLLQKFFKLVFQWKKWLKNWKDYNSLHFPVE